MTAEMLRLAKLMVEAFIGSRGDLSRHADILTERFTPAELGIPASKYLSDSDAAPVLLDAFRRSHARNARGMREKEMRRRIGRQINHARSVAIHGMTGMCDEDL